MSDMSASPVLRPSQFRSRAELLDARARGLAAIRPRVASVPSGVALVAFVLLSVVGEWTLTRGLEPGSLDDSGFTLVKRGLAMVAISLVGGLVLQLRSREARPALDVVAHLDRTPAARALPGRVPRDLLTPYDARDLAAFPEMVGRAHRRALGVRYAVGLHRLAAWLGLSNAGACLLLLPSRTLTTSVLTALLGAAVTGWLAWVAADAARALRSAGLAGQQQRVDEVLYGSRWAAHLERPSPVDVVDTSWGSQAGGVVVTVALVTAALVLDGLGPRAVVIAVAVPVAWLGVTSWWRGRDLRRPRADSGMLPDAWGTPRVTETREAVTYTFADDSLTIAPVAGDARAVVVPRDEVLAVNRWTHLPWLPPVAVLVHADQPLLLYGEGVADRAATWHANGRVGVRVPGRRSTC